MHDGSLIDIAARFVEEKVSAAALSELSRENSGHSIYSIMGGPLSV